MNKLWPVLAAACLISVAQAGSIFEPPPADAAAPPTNHDVGFEVFSSSAVPLESRLFDENSIHVSSGMDDEEAVLAGLEIAQEAIYPAGLEYTVIESEPTGQDTNDSGPRTPIYPILMIGSAFAATLAPRHTRRFLACNR